ncbi:MAG: UvrD-helicase domain-containing protein [Halobacteriovoraceae bacterium]|nr:UvrD-helicase domain-containing protein [Halobacteriovoraceae bacterium]
MNSEQALAVQAHGGTVLRAGAGAGKTYVIIEHLVHYLEENLLKKIDLHGDKLFVKNQCQDFLRSVAVVTFTRKSASELQERVKRKIIDLSSKDEKWNIVLENLNKIFVGTIHSLCLRIIRDTGGDYSLENLKVEDDFVIKRKIEKLIDEYLEINQNDIELIKLKKDIANAISKVFLDAHLRLQWEQSSIELSKTSEYYEDFWHLKSFQIPQCQPSKKGKWFDVYKKTHSIKESHKNIQQKLEELYQYYSEIKRMPPTPKEGISEEVEHAYSKIKDFKIFLKKFMECVESYEEHFEDTIVKTYQSIKQVFDFVSENYFKDLNISYTDLEYLSLKIPDQEITKFNKLIIDEYQDVSVTQYEIIKKIIGGNFDHLFAVGDIKQAIYGFRGGEVSVFSQTEAKVKNCLELHSNYRSDKSVVEFNNIFFSKKLPHFFRQTAMREEVGGVHEFNVNLNQDLSKEQWLKLEADIIFKEIQNKIKNFKTIAVLYKYLAPSKYLVKKIMNSQLGLEALVKVQGAEDPILSIFSFLLKYIKKTKKSGDDLKLAQFYIEGFFHYIDLDKNELEQNILDFENKIPVYGVYLSFINFLVVSRLNLSQYRENLEKISKLCRIYNDNAYAISNSLAKMKEDRLSFEFMKNGHVGKIEIMTAHASKGLEFECVFIGGVMANARGGVDSLSVGKERASFSYLRRDNKKEKTPQYFLEREIARENSEFESRRLFYVCCTRAEKDLNYVVSRSGTKTMEKRSWAELLLGENIDEVEQHDVVITSESFEENQSLRPAYQVFDFSYASQKSHKSVLGFLPELSVTRFAKLSLCPRKFYYEEILQIDEKQCELINHLVPAPARTDAFIDKPKGVSYAQRGSEVHFVIHKYLKNEISTNERTKFSDILNWVEDSLKNKFDKFELISEKEIKFSLNHYMMTGTPDLVLLSKDSSELEIWDFKTGIVDESTAVIYKAQLAAYAYGIVQVYGLENIREIKTKNLYVDCQEIMEYSWASMEILESYIQEIFFQFYSYDKKVEKHCRDCSYQSLCYS